MDIFNRPPTQVPPIQDTAGYSYNDMKALVRCSLVHISLDSGDRVPYETVTYVWGSHADRAIIELEGIRVEVPSSSEAVLRRVRSPSDDRMIWIDAICINQHDLVERGQQVNMMSAIFQGGAGNLIHLGDSRSADVVALALGSLRLVLQDIEEEANDQQRQLCEMMYDEEGVYRALSSSKSAVPTTEDEDNILGLFSLAWFRRLWVLQEAALSVRNTCMGHDSEFELRDVLRVAAWIGLRGQDGSARSLTESPGRASAAQMFDIVDRDDGFYVRGRDTASLSLVDALDIGRQLETTQPQDNIFALRGLLADSIARYPHLARLVMADYTKLLWQVMCDATRFAICESGDLYPLQFISHRHNSEVEHDMPSWAIRAERPFDVTQDPRALFGHFQASGSRGIDPLELSDTRYSRVLRLSGVVVDRITNVGQPIGSALWDIARDLEDALEATKVQFANTDPLLLTDALLAGANVKLEHGLDFSKVLTASPDAPSTLFRSTLRKASRCRRLFSTATGKIGIGPRSLQPGDMIVILFGGKVPFCLREAQNDYLFLGQAYVKDIMGGEAVSKDTVPRTFDVI
ncbi:Putative heterokaryon incompatibility [Septoria linicola]|uniref:Heterokaryon incompatibility n=1 Tax=Septoria linicola TaxID=215465 RepID=A0A9Q9B5Q7_9PEZI|nr:Putative heterokaryon incompatibility [Septoria linicola]